MRVSPQKDSLRKKSYQSSKFSLLRRTPLCGVLQSCDDVRVNLHVHRCDKVLLLLVVVVVPVVVIILSSVSSQLSTSTQ
jgi:hypothetical protein